MTKGEYWITRGSKRECLEEYDDFVCFNYNPVLISLKSLGCLRTKFLKYFPLKSNNPD